MSTLSVAKLFIVISTLFGVLCVGLGAYGAHALASKTDKFGMAIWQTAIQYQMFHTLVLLIVGFLVKKFDSSWLRWSGFSFALGIVLFCGSLYALVLSQFEGFARMTPYGGGLLVVGWLCLCIYGLRFSQNE